MTDPSDPPGPDGEMRARVLAALRNVIDPEVGLDVVQLGLVYGIDFDSGKVRVRLSMTTPECPLGDEIVRDATQHLRGVPGVGEPEVALVLDPPWTPDRMSAEARKFLGWRE